MDMHRWAKKVATAASPLAVVTLLAAPSPARAAVPLAAFTHVTVGFQNSTARRLAGCVMIAEAAIRRRADIPENRCAGFATATGGAVDIKGVTVTVYPARGQHTTFTGVDVTLTGEDVRWLASCLAVLQRTADAADRTTCTEIALVPEGVNYLTDLDITIVRPSLAGYHRRECPDPGRTHAY